MAFNLETFQIVVAWVDCKLCFQDVTVSDSPGPNVGAIHVIDC